MVSMAKERQQATGVKLLWGTANLFSHPRYMNGAATNPDFNVVARAAVQVKAALDATVELGGENYVFWGGREGYATLHNTNMKRELDHFARFLTLARDYGRSIGFKGSFFIEPKPMEPMKHQYDFDSATVAGFLKQHGLERTSSSTSKPTTPPCPAIPSSTTCRSLPTTDCSAASMRIAATRRTAGTPINSRPISTTRWAQ
jgi:xylose isomerase